MAERKKNSNRGFVRVRIALKIRKSDSGEGVSALFSLVAVSAPDTFSALVLFLRFAEFGLYIGGSLAPLPVRPHALVSLDVFRSLARSLAFIYRLAMFTAAETEIFFAWMQRTTPITRMLTQSGQGTSTMSSDVRNLYCRL